MPKKKKLKDFQIGYVALRGNLIVVKIGDTKGYVGINKMERVLTGQKTWAMILSPDYFEVNPIEKSLSDGEREEITKIGNSLMILKENVLKGKISDKEYTLGWEKLIKKRNEIRAEALQRWENDS